VVEVETKVEEGAGDGGAVDEEAGLGEMPSSRSEESALDDKMGVIAEAWLEIAAR
jgi:hypothetical protein